MRRVHVALAGLFVLLRGTPAPAAEQAQDISEIAPARVLSAPRPDYPYEARQRQITGTGVVILDIIQPREK